MYAFRLVTVSSLHLGGLQAVVTLRDAAVREWATTPKHDQHAMRGYVLHHVLRHARTLQRILPTVHADLKLMRM